MAMRVTEKTIALESGTPKASAETSDEVHGALRLDLSLWTRWRS
jgi:hypothetical protein